MESVLCFYAGMLGCARFHLAATRACSLAITQPTQRLTAGTRRGTRTRLRLVLVLYSPSPRRHQCLFGAMYRCILDRRKHANVAREVRTIRFEYEYEYKIWKSTRTSISSLPAKTLVDPIQTFSTDQPGQPLASQASPAHFLSTWSCQEVLPPGQVSNGLARAKSWPSGQQAQVVVPARAGVPAVNNLRVSAEIRPAGGQGLKQRGSPKH